MPNLHFKNPRLWLQLIVIAAFMLALMTLYEWFQQVLMPDISQRKQAEVERERLISDLQKALSEVKVLSGMLPICASCKRIRNDEGYWQQIASYISAHSETEFSHGVCPECARILYPGFTRNTHPE